MAGANGAMEGGANWMGFAETVIHTLKGQKDLRKRCARVSGVRLPALKLVCLAKVDGLAHVHVEGARSIPVRDKGRRGAFVDIRTWAMVFVHFGRLSAFRPGEARSSAWETSLRLGLNFAGPATMRRKK